MIDLSTNNSSNSCESYAKQIDMLIEALPNNPVTATPWGFNIVTNCVRNHWRTVTGENGLLCHVFSPDDEKSLCMLHLLLIQQITHEHRIRSAQQTEEILRVNILLADAASAAACSRTLTQYRDGRFLQDGTV